MNRSLLSPVMLIAADGFLQNQGLAINDNLIVNIANYTNTEVVSSYTNVLSTALGVLSSGVFAGMQTLGNGSLPAVTNAVTAEYMSQIGGVAADYTGGLSGLLLQQANRVLGNGDLGKFAQVFSIVQGFVYTTNRFVYSTTNANRLSKSFSGMTSLSTGSVADISDNLPLLAEDLKNLGTAWDMRNLEFLGNPWMLLRQLAVNGKLLPSFLTRLADQGIDNLTLVSIVASDTPPAPETARRIYRAMQQVTGNELEEAKILLDVKTKGITSLADLLNPIRALPNSYLTLQIRISTGIGVGPLASNLVKIYSPANTVNSSIQSTFENSTEFQRLSLVMPPDQALANQAIGRTLMQIKNIFVTTLPDFADAVSETETLDDLSQITGLQQPVPDSVISSLTSRLGIGTGPDGSLTFFDCMGTPTGIPYSDLYALMTSTLDFLSSTDVFDPLINDIDGAYTVMDNTLNGDYTTVIPPENPEDPETIEINIPAGLPGAGTYESYDDAFSVGLIPDTNGIISAIASNIGESADRLNQLTDDITSLLIQEINNLASAQVEFDELVGDNQIGLLSIATNLHSLGTDIGPTGTATYFDAIADTSNIYGQAVVAGLREGRNIQSLGQVGIQIDSQVPLGNIRTI